MDILDNIWYPDIWSSGQLIFCTSEHLDNWSFVHLNLSSIVQKVSCPKDQLSKRSVFQKFSCQKISCPLPTTRDFSWIISKVSDKLAHILKFQVNNLGHKYLFISLEWPNWNFFEIMIMRHFDIHAVINWTNFETLLARTLFNIQFLGQILKLI